MSLLFVFQLGLATDTYQLDISNIIEANQETETLWSFLGAQLSLTQSLCYVIGGEHASIDICSAREYSRVNKRMRGDDKSSPWVPHHPPDIHLNRIRILKNNRHRRLVRHSLSPHTIEATSQGCSAVEAGEIFDLSEWLVVSFHTYLKQHQHKQIEKPSLRYNCLWNPKLGHHNWGFWFSSLSPVRSKARYHVIHCRPHFPHHFTGNNDLLWFCKVIFLEVFKNKICFSFCYM